MRKKLGVGVIGLGMGRDLFYLNHEPNTCFEVRGVCGVNPEKAARIAAQNGIGFSTPDYHELLHRDDIHVIAVFSPDHLHGEHCLAALRAGKHVLVTKPMVDKLSEAVAITREAEARGLKLLVGETCRWYASFLALRRFYEDGDLGRIDLCRGPLRPRDQGLFRTYPWEILKCRRISCSAASATRWIRWSGSSAMSRRSTVTPTAAGSRRIRGKTISC